MRRSHMRILCLVALVAHGGVVSNRADEPQSLKNHVAPGPNKKDEPLAKQFSLKKAGDFLDSAALDWHKKQKCFACHTNYAYLYARPVIADDVPAHRDIRQALEDMVAKTWPAGKPRWDAEVVATAAALAYNDGLTTKKLHPLTKSALDRMWTVQRKDGGFCWLKASFPPMEYDDHYGVTLAALAVLVAPEDYAKTGAAQQGLAGLKRWLKQNPPENLHHKAMLLWVSSYLPAKETGGADDFMTVAQRTDAIKQLRGQQLPDGGWSTASLGDWKRGDKTMQDLTASDGYGTGFSVFVLRRAGVDVNDPAIKKGVDWLKSNQRESGRWFTRSLNRDNTHYLTHIGSAFAVMAIQACD